jgi:hypothetical protein
MSRALTLPQRQALWWIAGLHEPGAEVPDGRTMTGLRKRGLLRELGWSLRLTPAGAQALVPEVDVSTWKRRAEAESFGTQLPEGPACLAWLEVRVELHRAWDGGAR